MYILNRASPSAWMDKTTWKNWLASLPNFGHLEKDNISHVLYVDRHNCKKIY